MENKNFDPYKLVLSAKFDPVEQKRTYWLTYEGVPGYGDIPDSIAKKYMFVNNIASRWNSSINSNWINPEEVIKDCIKFYEYIEFEMLPDDRLDIQQHCLFILSQYDFLKSTIGEKNANGLTDLAKEFLVE